VLACAGLVGILTWGGIVLDAWYARWAWLRSEDHQRIERQLGHISAWRPEAEPAPPQSATGVTGGPGTSTGDAGPAAEGGPVPGRDATLTVRDAPRHPTLEPVSLPTEGQAARQVVDEPSADRAPHAVGADIAVHGAEFRFLDPPEPGAHARLTVTLRNRAPLESGPISVGVPAEWFGRYRIIGAVPPVLADRAHEDGTRYFDFPGPAPGDASTLELHVAATDEEVSSPEIRLALLDGDSIGTVRPQVIAPRPRPGPVRAVSIPRLGIRTGVVETAWEPPPFVAGQIRASAALGEGNAVLIGHRDGRTGNIFARLPGARLGDEVVATSRGLEHRLVVSEISTRPGSDSSPIGPSETPRLTLMTCVGAWNPLTGDYSHRLWVVAEPPDLARATLAAVVERANRIAAGSTTPTDIARARADAAAARAALALMRP
jgi:hypothetical protein